MAFKAYFIVPCNNTNSRTSHRGNYPLENHQLENNNSNTSFIIIITIVGAKSFYYIINSPNRRQSRKLLKLWLFYRRPIPIIPPYLSWSNYSFGQQHANFTSLPECTTKSNAASTTRTVPPPFAPPFSKWSNATLWCQLPLSSYIPSHNHVKNAHARWICVKIKKSHESSVFFMPEKSKRGSVTRVPMLWVSRLSWPRVAWWDEYLDECYWEENNNKNYSY